MTDKYQRIREALAMEPTDLPMYSCNRKQAEVVMAFKSACSPSTIRALLEERDALADENERLHAELEADRKRRGEPVAWIQRSYLNLIRESNVALQNVVVRGSILDGDGDVVPLFTAPQRAESSGAPTLHNDDSGAQKGNHAPQPAEPEPCFCDRMYPDSNPDASCGDCPIRDWGAKAAEPVKVPSDALLGDGNDRP